MSAAAARARQALLADLPVQQRTLELAGITTAILEAGEGPPMVLLHGLGEYGAKWFRILPGLVGDRRVIAPDLPGHGETFARATDISIDRLNDWLGELIDQTCATPPLLVGHVTGGALAAHFASRQPHAISQLVLVDTLGLAPFQPAPHLGQALMAFVAEPNRQTHTGLWQVCAYDLDALRASMGEQWSRFETYNLDRANIPEHQAAQQVVMQVLGLPPIAPAILESIRVPTSLIWGRHDLATALSVAERASAQYGWPLHIIEDAADDPAGEQPEAFVRVLRAIS
jgi:pimeloyl-ACP methyl ester carboxylesterase